MKSVAAIDLGATSGRVIVGTIDDGILHLKPVVRFPNTPVRLDDGLHWDVLSLYSAAMTGLGRASREHADLVGAAVDSWAVDYGLLRGGLLLGNPYHYRDDRTGRGVALVQKTVSAAELFRRNGLQHLPFNTVFQLAAETSDGMLPLADRLLLIPDLIAFWATGRAVAEQTNASTTGLVRTADSGWDDELLELLGLPTALLPEIVPPGTLLGPVTAGVSAEFGIAPAVRFSTVGSHDTASAVVGVPMSGEHAAYISCGTWSLVGVELSAPLTTAAAQSAGFTNEGGVDGRTRFLKNVMGLWLLSESVRAWAKGGVEEELGALLRAAADAPGAVATFDPNDPRLLAPGDMPSRIAALLTEQGCPVPTTHGEYVRCVLQSLANAYTATIRDIERLTGTTIDTVHMVGGGAQNDLLCRLTAETSGLSVIAGPVEATAIGNLLVQARTHGMLSGDLETLRAVVAASFPPRIHTPASIAAKKG